MKLSELRPCDSCNGPLTGKNAMRSMTWYVVRVSQAMLNPRAANEVLGMTQYFQGALGMAEIMTPRPDEAVMILGDKEPQLMTELFLCLECACEPKHGLAILIEKRNEAISKKEQTADETMASDMTEEGDK